MRNFQDTFETQKRSFISAFSICMTVPLNLFWAPGVKGLNGDLRKYSTYQFRVT